ncbi:sulfatase-like hydrolase/transferase [Opitutales bacterium]|nr:sulfatase-like hydrolase/transferase [Opitutales bacterium]
MKLKLVAFIFLSLCGSIYSWAKPEPLPNVVMILSDDQGFGDYGFMGHEMIETPSLDRLASQSLRYDRGYVTTALCSSSLTTMLTGLYPHEHGTTGNDPLKGISRQPWIDKFKNSPQLPKLLAKHGYISLHTGKYWHAHPKYSGFTHDMGATQRHGSAYSLSIGRDTMKPISDFLREAKGKEKPFFIWYAPFLPHTPHNPPADLEKKYRDIGAGGQAKYYAMCEWFDQSCGQLLDDLDNLKLSDNTLVVYACDNGWGRLDGKRGSVKASPYEQGVRTPIMFRWPAKISPQINSTDLASNLDLVPTILKACGIKPDERMSGIDLLNPKAVKKRKSIFLENFTHDMLDVDRPETALRARSIVEQNWKLTRWTEPHVKLKSMVWQIGIPQEKVELFDLTKDPLESTNVSTLHPKKVEELTKQLNSWWNLQVVGKK